MVTKTPTWNALTTPELLMGPKPYRTMIAARPIPNTALAGSTIAAPADLTGAADVDELVFRRVVAEVVVDV